ncbi:MAG TPA: TrkA C-terminal domain-containing protein [Thermodesulfobacteriota bacterium]|nr:TrkA C-terminal domain-containing protein [Thermodesulfobacteriota bacterium]
MPFWEQIKGKTQAVQIKLRMLLLENSIDTTFLRLGSRTYDLSKSNLPFSEDGEVKSIIQEISTKTQELAQLKEEFQKSWREEAKELKFNLEKGDGALEQVEVSFLSPVTGKKIKDLRLPREVLLGPILRGKELIIPDGETEILAGDRVTLMGKKKDVDSTVKILKAMT